MKIFIVVTDDCVNDVTYSRKSVDGVEKRRRHMINHVFSFRNRYENNFVKHSLLSVKVAQF